MSVLFTYTLPRTFFKYNIPIAFQSTILREYAKKNNLNFSLPVTELIHKDSYVALSNIFLKNKKIRNFGVVSGFVFPIDDIKLLKLIFKNYKNNNNIKFHLVLESKVLKLKELYLWCEDNSIKKKIINKF